MFAEKIPLDAIKMLIILNWINSALRCVFFNGERKFIIVLHTETIIYELALNILSLL